MECKTERVVFCIIIVFRNCSFCSISPIKIGKWSDWRVLKLTLFNPFQSKMLCQYWKSGQLHVWWGLHGPFSEGMKAIRGYYWWCLAPQIKPRWFSNCVCGPPHDFLHVLWLLPQKLLGMQFYWFCCHGYHKSSWHQPESEEPNPSISRTYMCWLGPTYDC